MSTVDTTQVVTDRPHHESNVFRWRTTKIGIDASRDELTFHDRHRLSNETAIYVHPDQALGEVAGRRQIKFDPPRATAFPEIKAMAVDGSFPLLRGKGAGSPGIHARLAGQPDLDRILLALVRRVQLASLGPVPPFLPSRRLGGATVPVPGASGDVWEIVGRLQELDGSEEQRISLLSAESDLHPRLIRIALDYAAEHADEICERINRNRSIAARSRRTSEQREALLA